MIYTQVNSISNTAIAGENWPPCSIRQYLSLLSMVVSKSGSVPDEIGAFHADLTSL